MIDELHFLGFCSSYSEVLRFERNAAIMNKTNLALNENSFVQHIADNADHDTCTLDGHGTFHGMAIIAAITPCAERSTVVIPREEVIITKS